MENQKKSVIIWVAIVVIVLLAFGYARYYLRTAPLVGIPPGEIPPRKSVGMPVPPAEDSVAAIDTELQGMSVDGLDSELADIEKELNN